MDHQHAAVTVPGDVQRVCHAGQGQRGHQNVGKPFFAVVQHFGEVGALQQDGRVDDGGSHRDDVAVGNVGLIDDVLDVGLPCQIVGRTHQLFLVSAVQTILTPHLRIAEVAVNE